MSRPTSRFAVCIESKADGDLIIRKIYEVLPDGVAGSCEYLRIIDESEEDYLYPARWFHFLDLPTALKRALRKTLTRRGHAGANKAAPRPARLRRR